LVVGAALVVAGVAWRLLPTAGTPTAYADSIAVLPIANQSGNPELEYVSDGITECLINNLSQFPRLKVIARTTAFRYKGRDVDPQQAGRELNVRRVFTGRLVRQGDFMGIQVDLVNVADGSQVWGYHYNQKLSDLVGLPENISGKISDSLQLKLSGVEQRRLRGGRTENQEAFRLYLLGRYCWNQRLQRRPGTVEKAIAYFEQAIQKDPGYALAYVGLAEAYATLPAYSEFSPVDAARKGKAAARRALEIDETVFEAYVALASIAADEWDWTEAEKGFRRALQLNPGYALAHRWYSECLEITGRVREAMAETQKAYELDPLSTAISLGLASLLYDDLQYDRAIQQFRSLLELDPDLAVAHMHIGIALLAQGKNKEALVELEQANALIPGGVVSLVGYAQAKLGNRQAALEILRQIQDPAKRHRSTPFDEALLFMGLGDMDRAFRSLDAACDQRAPLIARVKVDPFFASLRSDRRYPLLLRRMNLTP
jgi:TolB-like protein/Tfp pilus assembly protein PilF